MNHQKRFLRPSCFLPYPAPSKPLTCAIPPAMGSADQHPHVALLAFPFGTHAAPLLSLASALASSPSAACASFSLLTSARSAASLSSAASTCNLKIIEIADGAPAGYVPPADRPEEEVGLFMRETPGNFREGVEKAVVAAGGVRVTCVVSDAFLWFAGEIARGLGVPWVALWTGGPCSLSAHLHTDLLRREIRIEEDALSAKLDRDLDFIPGLSGLRARDLPEGIVTGDITGKFATLLHKMGLELPNATAVALNSFQGINPDLESHFAAKFKKCLHVGPLNLLLNPSPVQPDRSDCIQWLDGKKPASVAYISFGTVMCLPPSELAELAAGVEASGVPFLWSMKDFVREQLPVGFLDRTADRGLVVPWAPQVEVLAHEAVGAFVTHCGWNSVLESITCGVPMLCRPFLGDQMLNASAVARVWRVGVRFEGEGIKRDDAARALRRVLGEEEGEGMRERAGVLKEMAVKAVGPEGSSVQNFKSLLEVIMKH